MVGLGVQKGIGWKHRVLLRGHRWLIVEGVVPDDFHVVPVGDNAILQGQNVPLALSLIAHIGVL